MIAKCTVIITYLNDNAQNPLNRLVVYMLYSQLCNTYGDKVEPMELRPNISVVSIASRSKNVSRDVTTPHSGMVCCPSAGTSYCQPVLCEAMLSGICRRLVSVCVCVSVYLCVCVSVTLRYCITSGSAIAEGPREALVSRNPATTKHFT